MSSSESEQGVRKSEEGQPSDRPSARASTIIVDPGLIAEAERLTESQRPRAISSEHELPESEPAAEAGETGETGEGLDLSFEEAERFAASFRASWEPPAPAAVEAPAATAPVVASEPRISSRPIAPEPVPARVLVSELPGANRQRTILFGSGAVAAFIVLAILGWLASRSGAPDRPGVDNPLANHAAPVPKAAPQAETAPKPEPAPAPALPAQPPAPSAEPEAAAPATATAEPTAPAEPVAAPVEAAPAPAAQPEAAPAQPEAVLVALQITTQPANARLTLDGAPIANPYDALHPQGGSHVVEATAPGYQARNLKIELTKKRSVALELERERAPEPPRATKPTRRPRPQRAAKPAPKAAPAKKGAAFVEESPY